MLFSNFLLYVIYGASDVLMDVMKMAWFYLQHIDWTAPLFNASLFELETPAVLSIMWMRWCSLKAQSRYMWHIVVQDNHRETNSDASDGLSTFLHGTLFKLAMRSNLKLETPAVFYTCKSWTRVTPTGYWIQANFFELKLQSRNAYSVVSYFR